MIASRKLREEVSFSVERLRVLSARLSFSLIMEADAALTLDVMSLVTFLS